MAAQTIKLAGDVQREHAKQQIDAAPAGARVVITDAREDRTSAQNRTLHMWFGQVAKHQGDIDALDVKGMSHRKWGLTIRLRDPQFAWIWERTGAGLNYEQQCGLLASGVLNVSSHMNVDELSEYLDSMSRHYRSEGIYLHDPELRKYQGQAA